jgi:hypothetical protein
MMLWTIRTPSGQRRGRFKSRGEALSHCGTGDTVEPL